MKLSSAITAILIVGLGLTAAPNPTAVAQELEPRQYSNLPVGLNFLAAGLSASEGSVLVDPAIALDNAELESRGPVLGYARSLALGARSAKFDAALGRVCLQGTAEFQGQSVSRDVCGVTDPKLRLSVNLLGAPALDMRQFASYRQDFVLGASLQLSVPAGQYDTTRVVNIGTNRWSARAELGLSKTFEPWIFELAVAGTFYADNDEFLRHTVRAQDPLYSIQAHLVRSFASGFWLALDATEYRGGRTRTAGLWDHNLQSNSRIGFTASIPVDARHSIKLLASTGVSTRTGSDFDVVAVLWQYRWGGSGGS